MFNLPEGHRDIRRIPENIMAGGCFSLAAYGTVFSLNPILEWYGLEFDCKDVVIN